MTTTLRAGLVILSVVGITLLSSPPPSASELVTPSPWPLQFHALLFINTSAGLLQAVDLWYDWPNGRNYNIIHSQLNNTLHDLEWTNGTSFYFDREALSCYTLHFDVGILRPDWIVHNNTYLGQQSIDGFTCNVWSKADDFIIYWEDIDTKRPVHWVFSSGMSVHVMNFEVGAVLDDSEWQAPSYCFSDENLTRKELGPGVHNPRGDPWRRWMHGVGHASCDCSPVHDIGAAKVVRGAHVRRTGAYASTVSMYGGGLLNE